MVSAKHAFWQALLAALLVFGLGVLAGFFLEGARSESVEHVLLDSEVSLQDEVLRERVLRDFNVDCALAEQNLFAFAERIYDESRKLEQYDAASKFTKELRVLHRRYDLLRAMLWTDSKEFNERCGRQFYTVVYLYAYDPQEVEQRARQSYYSRLLEDLKERNGNDVLLIPLAANLNLSSVDLLAAHAGVTELPAILVDNRSVITSVITLKELEAIVMSGILTNRAPQGFTNP